MNHKIILLLNKEGEVKNDVLRINKFIIEFEFNYKVEKKNEKFFHYLIMAAIFLIRINKLINKIVPYYTK